MLRILGVITAVLLSVQTASAELTATAPRDVALPAFSASESDEHSPRIASDGRSYVAVWENTDFDVRATRISGTGAVDPPAFTLGTGHWPDIAFGGGRYLVSWTENDARAAFIDDDGVSASFELGPRPIGRSMVAFNGTTFLVMWRADARGYEGAFVSTSGVVSPRVRVPVLNVVRQQKLVSAGGRFFLATATGGRVSLVPVTPNGAGAPIPIARVSGFSELHAGTSGDDVVLAWQLRDTIQWVIANGVGTVQSFEAKGMSLQTIISGDSAQIVYGNATATYARRALPGAVASELPLPSIADGVADAAWSDSFLALVFVKRGFPLDVFAQVVGGVRGAVNLDMRPVQQFAADIAGGDALSLAVWSEWRGADPRAIVAGRLDAQARTLDPAGITIMTGIGGIPRVAWNGSVWLVTVHDFNRQRIAAVRVSPAGKVLDAEPIAIPTINASLHALAWDGSQWIVTYFDSEVVNGSASLPHALNVVRVAANGAVSERVKLGVVNAPRALEIDATSGGAFIVWDSVRGVEGAVLTPGNTPIPIRISAVTGHGPDVVWNGESFLVAFVETHTRVIEWQLVSLDGTARTPLPPFIPIDSERFIVTVHATTFEGRTLLAWNDGFDSPVVALLDTDGTIRENRTALGSAPTYLPILASGSILFHQTTIPNEDGNFVRATARKLTRR